MVLSSRGRTMPILTNNEALVYAYNAERQEVKNIRIVQHGVHCEMVCISTKLRLLCLIHQ
jgi:hypothetical protein